MLGDSIKAEAGISVADLAEETIAVSFFRKHGPADMFYDGHASGSQDARLDGQLQEIVVGEPVVGRIQKNDVRLRSFTGARPQKPEGILAEDVKTFFYTAGLEVVADQPDRSRIMVNKENPPRSAADRLDPDRTGA